MHMPAHFCIILGVGQTWQAVCYSIGRNLRATDKRKRRSKKGETTMQNKAAKFTFSVPDGHPEKGKKLEKSFEYQECETVEEAQAILEKKEIDVKDLVNEWLKRNARSNAYQSALLPYRTSVSTPDEIKERMVRDFIRLGVPEELARKQVDGILANTPAAE